MGDMLDDLRHLRGIPQCPVVDAVSTGLFFITWTEITANIWGPLVLGFAKGFVQDETPMP
jgi:hypothetical protein